MRSRSHCISVVRHCDCTASSTLLPLPLLLVTTAASYERYQLFSWRFVRWSSNGHLTLIQTAAKGLFLDKISVSGVVLSGYNTWMNSYGEDELAVPVEPEPWQLHYIDCMVCHLTTLSSTICYGAELQGPMQSRV
jgi:hypothetical protein